MNWTNEAAFETVIEAHLLQNGYVPWIGRASTVNVRFFPSRARVYP